MDRTVRSAVDALLALSGAERRRLMLRAHHARRRLAGGYGVQADDPLLTALVAMSSEQFGALVSALASEGRKAARRRQVVQRALRRRKRAEYMRRYRMLKK